MNEYMDYTYPWRAFYHPGEALLRDFGRAAYVHCSPLSATNHSACRWPEMQIRNGICLVESAST
jgi:hypothetical protein